MNEPDQYDIASYGIMIADKVRIGAYLEALRGAVKPGSIVLDLGTGTGICALIACSLGAGRVYAIEPSQAIQVAREVARDSGFADRIEFIQDISTHVSLPESADVMVSDLRGILPLFRHHLPAIIDARRRLLAADGAMIPQRDDLYVAVVEAADNYEKIVGPWTEDGDGIDLRAARKFVVNRWRSANFDQAQLLTAPVRWASLNYSDITTANAAGTVEARVERSGTAHGLALWFDTVLHDEVGFSNAPGQEELVYGRAFFPFPEAVALAAGDAVAVRVRADLVGDDYVWRWSTTLRPSGATAEIQFEQSDFYGDPLSPDQLRKQAGNHVPTLHAAARLDLEALRLMDGSATLQEIAERLRDLHPGTFRDAQEALNHVAALSRRYSE